MKERCETKLYTLCLSGFLIQFLKELAKYHQNKESCNMETRQVQHFQSKTFLVIVILFHNYTSSILFFQWRTAWCTILCICCFTKRDAGCWWHVFWNCCSFFSEVDQELLPRAAPSFLTTRAMLSTPLTGIQRLTSFLVCWVEAFDWEVLPCVSSDFML